MYILKQKGFDQFHCIASKCPESCCKFWQIVPDPESIVRYRALGETDGRVRANVNEKEEVFRQNGRICGFLDPDELCYLQKSYGEEALCDTCRNYPRHAEEFENVREYSLSLSCPHAAERLLNDPEPMTFAEEETKEEEEFEDFDYLLYDKLADAREFLFSIAQDRSLPLIARLGHISRFGKEMQNLLDDGDLFELDEQIDEFRTAVKGKDKLPSWLQDPDVEKRTFSVLFELEKMHTDWTGTLEKAWKLLINNTSDEETVRQFRQFADDCETAGEQILMLLLYTYFCGAVYDGWILSKTLLCTECVKWIFYIAFSSGADQNALIRSAYQLAREIEHSDLNLDHLEEWFMKTR